MKTRRTVTGKMYWEEELCVTRSNYVLQEQMSCHRKIFPVTWRQFLLQEEICHYRKKFTITGRNLPSKEDIPVKGKIPESGIKI